jgi:hypothetical protein
VKLNLAINNYPKVKNHISKFKKLEVRDLIKSKVMKLINFYKIMIILITQIKKSKYIQKVKE